MEPYIGKVRTVREVGYGTLMLSASDRLSSFDRHICDIPNKGYILNKTSEWWFRNTTHIIPNHLLYSVGRHMFVKRAERVNLEFVVRGYMTGSTETSIWPMYKSGKRNMYGLEFREGYRKNEKLDQVIITPTTKGVRDSPITPNEIVHDGYLTREEWNYLSNKAIQLFKFGQMVAEKKGLILVDTKYEFGRVNGELILIDELHTCDSSRYWKAETYVSKFLTGQEPEKLDKDCIRDYVKSKCDPYKDSIPEIPTEHIQKVRAVYSKFYYTFIDEELPEESFELDIDMIESAYFNEKCKNLVVILAGSKSDSFHCEKISTSLKIEGIYSIIHYCSAHKETRRLLDILERYEGQQRNIVYVAVAGMSNALGGVVTCNTRFPVISCPPFKDLTDMQVNIHSSLQCPSKVPAMTVLSPGNVALSVKKIFNFCS